MREQTDLNEHHRRRLLVSCQYIDRLLASIENAAAAGTSLSPFPRYVQDLTAQEQEDMRERVARLAPRPAPRVLEAARYCHTGPNDFGPALDRGQPWIH